MTTGIPTLGPTGVPLLSPTGVRSMGTTEPQLPVAGNRILIVINDCRGVYYPETPQDPLTDRMFEEYREDADVAMAAGASAVERGVEPWAILVQQAIPTDRPDPGGLGDPDLLWPPWTDPRFPPTYEYWFLSGIAGVHVREWSEWPQGQQVDATNMSDSDWVTLMRGAFRHVGPPTQVWIDASPDLTIDLIPGLNLLLHGTAPPWEDSTWEQFYPGLPRPVESHRANRRWPRWISRIIEGLDAP